ncbi:uncharacterized protein [Montipora foliosa]|uniref:uncharacterized protein n=1 Tax=Montipora foliosa TaxID=591990 RepID=UPI0035F0FDE7
MTKAVGRKAGKRGSENTNNATTRASKLAKKHPCQFQEETSRKWIVVIFTICTVIGAILAVSLIVPAFQVRLKNKALRKGKLNEQKASAQDNGGGKRLTTEAVTQESYLPKELRNFKLSVQSRLTMKNIKENNHEMKIQELRHERFESYVNAYVVENFLSDHECQNLVIVHQKHVSQLNKQGPIICFDGIKSFREYLKDAKLKIKVSQNDFTEGTTCVNETFSTQLQAYFTWSFSTAFYPGESKFSTIFAERIQRATGLKLENGGKFQITSYPQNVGYKNHTDCIVNHSDKRDRFATVLVYLKDVEEGGETKFPQLGISVKPRKGLALIWNSMNSKGECDLTSLHNAAKVVKGQKFIIQRWYYYHNFPSLGKRPQEPRLPQRHANQPRVSCDEYEQGSCRWYDEWNYDHLVEYTSNINNLI